MKAKVFFGEIPFSWKAIKYLTCLLSKGHVVLQLVKMREFKHPIHYWYDMRIESINLLTYNKNNFSNEL